MNISIEESIGEYKIYFFNNQNYFRFALHEICPIRGNLTKMLSEVNGSLGAACVVRALPWGGVTRAVAGSGHFLAGSWLSVFVIGLWALRGLEGEADLPGTMICSSPMTRSRSSPPLTRYWGSPFARVGKSRVTA
jgi:hypothetical protein